MDESVDAAFVTDGALLNRTSTNGSGKPMIPAARTIKIPIRQDPNPLARFEYLLFLSAFWNVEKSALGAWNAGVGQYECNVNQVGRKARPGSDGMSVDPFCAADQDDGTQETGSSLAPSRKRRVLYNREPALIRFVTLFLTLVP